MGSKRGDSCRTPSTIGSIPGEEASPAGVSVIICCYNSMERLPATLNHLAAQISASSIPWEVLVIDNASSDATAAVARKVWPDAAPAPLRVVTEPITGLTHARHRGLIESRFEFLSFVDDDNWVAPDWVASVFKILSTRPEVAVCGGRGEPVPESANLPDWFETYAGAYAVGAQGETEGYVSRSRSRLYGAGMSIRKSAWTALIAAGFHPMLTDRKGNSLASGGDSELCYALVLSGWKLWYDPDLTFKHYLPAGRLTWDYLRRLYRDFGASAVWLEQYKELIDPARNVAFRYIPLPANACSVVRRSWMFQAYATARTLWSMFRSAAFSKEHSGVEGDAEGLRAECEVGRAICLLKSAPDYDRTFARLKHASWRQQEREGRETCSGVPADWPLQPAQARAESREKPGL